MVSLAMRIPTLYLGLRRRPLDDPTPGQRGVQAVQQLRDVRHRARWRLHLDRQHAFRALAFPLPKRLEQILEVRFGEVDSEGDMDHAVSSSLGRRLWLLLALEA